MGHLVPNRQVLSGPIPFVLIKGFPPSASPVEKPPECYFVILFVYIYPVSGRYKRVGRRVSSGACGTGNKADPDSACILLVAASRPSAAAASLSPGLHSKMNEGIPRERGKSKLSCALLPFVLLSHSILVVVESSSVLRLIELS